MVCEAYQTADIEQLGRLTLDQIWLLVADSKKAFRHLGETITVSVEEAAKLAPEKIKGKSLARRLAEQQGLA